MEKKLFQKVVTRNYGVLSSELFIRGYSNPHYMEKMFFLPNLYIRQAVILDEWYYPNIKKDIGDLLLEKDYQKKGFLLKVFSKIYKFGGKLIDRSVVIKNTNFSELSDEGLAKIANDFFKNYEIFSATLAGWRIQIPIEARLRDILKDRKNIEEELAVLSFPIKKNIASEEQEDLLKIAAEMQKGKIRLNALDNLSEKYQPKLKKHAEKFGWMTRGGFDDAWTEKKVFDRLKELVKQDCRKKLSDLEKNRKQIKNKATKILKRIKANQEARRLIKIAKELVYFRTYRTDILNLAMFNIRPLLAEIGRRKGYSFREMAQFRVDEIIGGKSVAKGELKKRMKNFIILTLKPGDIFFSSNPAEIKKYEEKYFEKDTETAEEIRGNVAFRGKAKGIVVVARNKSELHKIERGNILVAPMTTPDFIGSMQKASAFVTDEGGITCHAAIVARELKKPCIIGTKIATKVLKDGDLVEVDAGKGVVKIIKKNDK